MKSDLVEYELFFPTWEESLLIVIVLLFLKKGVDLEKLLDAGDFICRALNRKSASKVAQARRGVTETNSWLITFILWREYLSEQVANGKTLYLFLPDRNGIPFMVNSTVEMEVAPKVMVDGSGWTVDCGPLRKVKSLLPVDVRRSKPFCLSSL